MLILNGISLYQYTEVFPEMQEKIPSQAEEHICLYARCLIAVIFILSIGALFELCYNIKTE